MPRSRLGSPARIPASLLVGVCALIAVGAWTVAGMPTLADILDIVRGNDLIRPEEAALFDAIVTGGAQPRYAFYGKPQVERTSSGVLISNDDADPAGAYLRFALDPESRYRLTLSGTTTAGTPVLRIGSGSAEYAYHAPIEGTDSLAFNGLSEYEVLIYSDQPFAYQLDAVHLESCTECRVDDDLRELILGSTSGLERRIADNPLGGARELLDWVANTGDYALSTELLQATDPRVARASAAGIYYEIFLPDAGAVYCGGLDLPGQSAASVRLRLVHDQLRSSRLCADARDCSRAHSDNRLSR